MREKKNIVIFNNQTCNCDQFRKKKEDLSCKLMPYRVEIVGKPKFYSKGPIFI